MPVTGKRAANANPEIVQVMIAYDIRQCELARVTGKSRVTINKWLKDPELDTARRAILARAIDEIQRRRQSNEIYESI